MILRGASILKDTFSSVFLHLCFVICRSVFVVHILANLPLFKALWVFCLKLNCGVTFLKQHVDRGHVEHDYAQMGRCICALILHRTLCFIPCNSQEKPACSDLLALTLLGMRFQINIHCSVIRKKETVRLKFYFCNCFDTDLQKEED